MKKISKCLTIFFGFYNLFLVIIAAFNLFNFSPLMLRVLLGLEALQVAVYKFCDVIAVGDTVPRCGPESTVPAAAPTVKITKVDAPTLKLRHAVRSSMYEYEMFEDDIKKSMAEDLGKEMFKNGVIKFDEQKDYGNGYITTIAEVDVVKY